eukprot:357339-Chlamydomonas_euryale.AAC.7
MKTEQKRGWARPSTPVLKCSRLIARRGLTLPSSWAGGFQHAVQRPSTPALVRSRPKARRARCAHRPPARATSRPCVPLPPMLRWLPPAVTRRPPCFPRRQTPGSSDGDSGRVEEGHMG